MSSSEPSAQSGSMSHLKVSGISIPSLVQVKASIPQPLISSELSVQSGNSSHTQVAPISCPFLQAAGVRPQPVTSSEELCRVELSA